jgi:hypothetical protein
VYPIQDLDQFLLTHGVSDEAQPGFQSKT